MSAAMVLFAVGNQILALPFPLCPPSALLRSLCTPANTRLITALSIDPRFTPKGKEVLSSLSLFCHSFPLLHPFHNLLSFLRALSSPRLPTYCCFLSGDYVCVWGDEHFKNLLECTGENHNAVSAGWGHEEIFAFKHRDIFCSARGFVFVLLTYGRLVSSSCVQQCWGDYFRQI